ncbi:MAG: hypothetical protein WC488_04560 [Candidatus Micrarchaeia archaeon]
MPKPKNRFYAQPPHSGIKEVFLAVPHSTEFGAADAFRKIFEKKLLCEGIAVKNLPSPRSSEKAFELRKEIEKRGWSRFETVIIATDTLLAFYDALERARVIHTAFGKSWEGKLFLEFHAYAHHPNRTHTKHTNEIEGTGIELFMDADPSSKNSGLSVFDHVLGSTYSFLQYPFEGTPKVAKLLGMDLRKSFLEYYKLVRRIAAYGERIGMLEIPGKLNSQNEMASYYSRLERRFKREGIARELISDFERAYCMEFVSIPAFEMDAIDKVFNALIGK